MHLPHHLRNLEEVARLRDQLFVDEHRKSMDIRLAERRCAFVHVPAVHDVWLVEQRETRWRQRFLVLEGPSGVGKSQFAMGLVPEGRALDVNCANTPEPDMRDFRRSVHELVLFDEATCSMVLRQKKLFQAGLSSVQLGCSQTNWHA